MQDGQVYGALHIELNAPPLDHAFQDVGYAQFISQPANDQIRSDRANGHRFRLSFGVGLQHPDRLAMAQPRTQKPFELSARLKHIESARRG